MKPVTLLLQIISENKKKIPFSAVPEHTIFSSNGVLYTKLFSQDLKEYEIDNVNAVGVLSGGLTFFQPDEEVFIEKVTLF